MSRPVKRGFLSPNPNDSPYDTHIEAQCKPNESLSKRQRQYSSSDLSRLSRGQHGAWFSNISGFGDQQSSCVKPNCAMPENDNINWDLGLHTDIPNLPLSSIGSEHSIAPGAQFSATLDPNFALANFRTHRLGSQTRNEFSQTPNCSLPDSGVPNGLQPQTIESFDSNNSPLFLWNRDSNHAEGFLKLDDLCTETNPTNWLECFSGSTTKSSPTIQIAHADAHPEAGATFHPHVQLTHIQHPISNISHIVGEDAHSSRLQIQPEKKTHRAILPLFLDRDQIDSSGGDSAFHPKDSFLRQKNESSSHESRPRFGRSKPLGTEAAKQAAKMRKEIACLRCRAMKLKCSPGEICQSCQKLPLCQGPCMRFNFRLYTDFFFPPLVNSTYKASVVEKFLTDNVILGFNNEEVEVQISSGPTYHPITVGVQEFQPLNEEFLASSQIETGNDGNLNSEFTRQYALPFMLPQGRYTELKDKCMEHVELISRGPRCTGELYYKDTANISWEVFNAIAGYQKSANSKLVGNAIVLYAMHFFMAQNLVFTEDSADAIIKALNRPTKHPYARTLTSNLVTLQVKQVMFELIHEKTTELLRFLEKTMRVGDNLDKTSWTASFCAISILCLCTEMIQSAMDLKTVHMMSEEGYSRLSRAKNMEQCREFPIFHFTQLFHSVFRSFQRTGTRKNERGFNPIRDGLNFDNRMSLDEPTMRFINEIARILADCGKHSPLFWLDTEAEYFTEHEIRDRFGEPPLDHDPDDLSDLLARHLTFRERNSGKLLSRFLLSFFRYS